MTMVVSFLARPTLLVYCLYPESGGEVVSRDLACRSWKSSRFVGDLECRGSSISFFRALMANPDEVVDVVFVDPESSEGSEVFFLPILLKRARFCRVSRASSKVGCVVCARFVCGLVLSSLSSCRFRDGRFTGRSSACESSKEVCFLSIIKSERKGDFFS